MNLKKIVLSILFCLFPLPFSHAYWVWSPQEGKFVNPEGEDQSAAEEQYEYGMKLYRDKNVKEAVDQLEMVEKKFPNSKTAAEALYRLGTIQEELGDYWKAFDHYKKLIETYPNNERFNEVIERELRIGNVFLSGKKARLLGLDIVPSISKAAEIFQHIVKHAPYSEFGDQAQFQLGLTYKKMGRFQESVDAFQALIDQYPQSPLLAEAKYQLAETSYSRSTAHYRDQRALDEASQEVDRFLRDNPDSEVSEKAEKLRQVIDEKNAEKNYRIGLYYENQRFLDSAVIYFADVAKRYPQTQWGIKAQEKLQSIKEPVEYHSKKKENLDEEIKILEAKLSAVPADDADEKKRIEEKVEVFKKKQSKLEKDKKNNVKMRAEDIKRRETDLKQKSKNLQAKKKRLKKNPSEDYQRAIERWESSLNQEKEALEKEKQLLREWKADLGIPDKKAYVPFLPFGSEMPTEIERVRSIEAKRLFKLSEEKREVLDAKESLYRENEELTAQIADVETVTSAGADQGTVEPLSESQADEARRQIADLEKQLDAKKELYENQFGKSGIRSFAAASGKIFSGTAQAVGKSLDAAWPGTGSKSAEDRLEDKRRHLKEKIAVQQNLTETLKNAFDQEMALQEQKKLLRELDPSMPQDQDPNKIRKEVKSKEKEIRKIYNEIQDLHDAKTAMLDEIDSLMKQKNHSVGAAGKVARVITVPAEKSAWFVKSFLFGIPSREVKLTESAVNPERISPDSQERARQLKQEIELHSLMIESKSRELSALDKELEILKAKASLAGGLKFRSVLVDVPYQFIEEAVDSAKKLVPKKGRDELIMNRLEEETQRLEAMKEELKDLESGLSAAAAPSSSTDINNAGIEGAEKVESSTEMDQNRKQLEKELSEMGELLQAQKKILARSSGTSLSDKDFKRKLDELESLRHEQKEIQGKLAKIIAKETELEQEEVRILEKRISEIDRAIQRVTSKALSQDLLTERGRMEARVTEIESRRDYLSKESERFNLVETARAAS